MTEINEMKSRRYHLLKELKNIGRSLTELKRSSEYIIYSIKQIKRSYTDHVILYDTKYPEKRNSFLYCEKIQEYNDDLAKYRKRLKFIEKKIRKQKRLTKEYSQEISKLNQAIGD